MIIWLVVFGIVIALSFILAVRSMREFKDISLVEPKPHYSLFLIRNTKNLTVQLLASIRDSLKKDQVLSLERLFKGNKVALVVFGPRDLLLNYSALDLLELEDYTEGLVKQFSASTIAIKSFDNLKLKLPKLSYEEELWWQITLSNQFKAQIRAVFLSADGILQNLAPENLLFDKDFSEAQILELYQKRSLSGKKEISLNPEQILKLLFI